MAPADEAEFARLVVTEPGTVFVDGQNWPSSQPPTTTSLQEAGEYLMIWNPEETPPLKGKRYGTGDGAWWSCESEHLTIQFLRSGFRAGKPFLVEGRIAVATTDQGGSYYHQPSAPPVEKRYKSLRKWIRSSYHNRVVIWQNLSLPRSRTNPLKPASDVWVGPHALDWLRQSPQDRWVQQHFSGARGYVIDLVEG